MVPKGHITTHDLHATQRFVERRIMFIILFQRICRAGCHARRIQAPAAGKPEVGLFPYGFSSIPVGKPAEYAVRPVQVG
jgi:hypothetical protein